MYISEEGRSCRRYLSSSDGTSTNFQSMRAHTRFLPMLLALPSVLSFALNLPKPILTGRNPAVAMVSAAPPEGFTWGAAESRPKPLEIFDKHVLSRAVRLGNHAPAFASLSYFGLISMTMLKMEPMAATAATLRAVITRGVGPTSNAAFASAFSTLVTPANFVFLIWPVISVLQLGTLAASALRPSAPLKQDTLTALSLANGFATLWLLTSSNAVKGALPLASLLYLPFVPLFAGYPLRSAGPPRGLDKLVFSIFSSFTTLASFLALAVELQYGGRLPLIGTLPAEAAALVFVGLTSLVVAQPKRTLAKKLVNLLALSGILARRVASASFSPLSLSFVATIACWGFAAKQLATGE